MAVATMTKAKPRIGDECYEVEWCSKMFVCPESGDTDPDRDEMSCERFMSLGAAERFAVAMYPSTLSGRGGVSLTHMQFTAYDDADADRHPTVGFWEAIADTRWFHGEWES